METIEKKLHLFLNIAFLIPCRSLSSHYSCSDPWHEQDIQSNLRPSLYTGLCEPHQEYGEDGGEEKLV